MQYQVQKETIYSQLPTVIHWLTFSEMSIKRSIRINRSLNRLIKSIIIMLIFLQITRTYPLVQLLLKVLQLIFGAKIMDWIIKEIIIWIKINKLIFRITIILIPQIICLIPTTPIYLAITALITKWWIKTVQLEINLAIISLGIVLIHLGTKTITKTCRFHSIIIPTTITTSWIALLTKIMYPFQVKTCLLMLHQSHKITLTYGILIITTTITMYRIRILLIIFGAVSLNLRHSLILQHKISGHSNNSKHSNLLIIRCLLIWMRVQWVLRIIKWDWVKSPQTTPIRITHTILNNLIIIITQCQIQHFLITTSKTAQVAVIHFLKCNRLTF